MPVITRNNIDAKDNNGWTALHYAVQQGRVEMVKLLLDKGASIDDEGRNGWTDLQFAVFKGYIEIISILLDKGAKVSACEKTSGMTALHYAAIWGNVDAVKEILKYSKIDDINIKDNNGKTALHYAATWGNVDLAQELVKYSKIEQGEGYLIDQFADNSGIDNNEMTPGDPRELVGDESL